jgi:3-oxoacyl-[acyl-carrier protein] reductase
MTDRYQGFVQSSLGQLLVKNLGLPDPVALKRYADGQPLVTGTVLTGGSGRLAESLPGLLDELDVTHAQTPDPEARYRALVLDATGITDSSRLGALRDFFGPLMRSLETCPRLVVIGTPPESVAGPERVAQRALEGFTRSLGKEVGRGGTAQLVYVAEGAEGGLLSTLAFLLSPKSAYVSGQVVRIGTTPGHANGGEVGDWLRPLEGKVALVTGAARGIGEATARLLADEGAHVICLDRPDDDALVSKVARDIGGSVLLVDITDAEAPKKIAEELKAKHGGLDVIIHNAGVTRDKTLAKMSESAWDSAVDINLGAVARITGALVDKNLIKDDGRVICLSSVAGLAGNLGQTNYSASKAGIVGYIKALAPRLAGKGITVNAIAPGFIETRLTAAIPVMIREAGRRLSAVGQGGQPRDVGEALLFLATPAASGISGSVLRVCGGAFIGA